MPAQLPFNIYSHGSTANHNGRRSSTRIPAFLPCILEMFGDPWARADAVNPIFPVALNQPTLVLPFEPNVEWSMTGGPHNAWGQINPNIYGENHSVAAAIDFAPSTDHGGCDPTPTWVTAAAPGLVVRSDNGAVMVDLDGDGYEQTGWNILYMHIAKKDRVPKGTWLEVE